MRRRNELWVVLDVPRWRLLLLCEVGGFKVFKPREYIDVCQYVCHILCVVAYILL